MCKNIIQLIAFILYVIINSSQLTAQDPLFLNSVVSNDIDFILDTDPDVFESLNFIGRSNKYIPGDPNGGVSSDINTFVFEANFMDGNSLEIWCHSSFLTEEAAKEYADKLCPRLGKLPNFQRNLLDHVVIHNGDGGAFAESEGQFFFLYSKNMDERISNHDLEETVFHESVHASYEFMNQNDPSWLDAQIQDPTFVTNYARDNPQREDMAESALFAYTLINHPGRLPEYIETWLMENIPNRLEFFRTIYSPSTNPNNCDSSNLTFNASDSPQGDYKAANTITANCQIQSQYLVIFEAGNSVTLQPSFHAVSGSSFSANIRACTFSSIVTEETEIEQSRNQQGITKTSLSKSPILQINPNPFENQTIIRFQLPKESLTEINIFNRNGQLLKKDKINGHQGWNTISFDGSQLPAGMHFIKLQTEEHSLQEKVILIK